jgi:predicted MPP superfamily phosphohydrolase
VTRRTDRRLSVSPRGHTPRTALVLLCTLALALVLFVWVTWTIQRDSYSPRLRQVNVEVPGLAHAVDVLQVSDLGGDRFGPKQSKLAALLAGQRFDAVVLTGDMLGTKDYEAVWELADVVKAHSSRVWYLPGNHDTPQVAAGLATRGVPSLPESRAVQVVDDDPSARDVALVYGRSSATIATAKGHGRELLVIASHTPPSATRLAAGLALGSGVHLYIAGHTHGGQVRLPLVGAIVAPMSWAYEERPPAVANEIVWWPDLRGRFVDGMYVRDGQRIFVTQGLESVSYYPRFLDQSEMVVYHFVPAPAH